MVSKRALVLLVMMFLLVFGFRRYDSFLEQSVVFMVLLLQ